MSTENSTEKVITTGNAAACTPYELRQELLRRGAFDLADDEANYKSMLKRLMVELVADEHKLAEQKTAVIESKSAAARDEAKSIREEKKREALERSKQRQQDPEYFKRISELNRKPDKEVATTTDSTSVEAADGDEGKVADENDSKPSAHDPFRPQHTNNQKNKVFVR